MIDKRVYIQRQMKKKFKKQLIFPAILLIGITFYLFVLAPYSRTSSYLVLTSYSTLRSGLILSAYAHQLEMKHRFLREPGEPSHGLPGDLEDELIRILRNGSVRDRESIIKFYIKVVPFTFCCWRMANYEDRTIIGDALQLARNMNDQDKYGALELVESWRRDRGKEMFKQSLNLKQREDIRIVFKLYEEWWQSALPLPEKLKLNPLEKSPYDWSGP
jgi:hypothetical protein